MKVCTDGSSDSSWCYLFVHNRKVAAIEALLEADGLTHFVHRSIRYAPKRGHASGVREVNVPSVSGLIFLQGRIRPLREWLAMRLPFHHLCRNCSTGRVAVIPDSQMQPFMRVAEADPERIRFLLHPFAYYAKNRTLLRITSGQFTGLEGYVLRIARDRRLVMDVGGMSVAIAGIHAERFEEVGKNEGTRRERETFARRNLQERQALIDRYFHQVHTPQEAAEQAESIALVGSHVKADLAAARITTGEAFAVLRFVVEEIGYYYAPLADSQLQRALAPVWREGAQIMQRLSRLAEADTDGLLAPECERLRTLFGYLFETADGTG